MFGRERDRRVDAESQHRFRIDHRRMPARQQHADHSSNGACARADTGTNASTGCRTCGRADRCRCPDSSSVTSIRRPTRARDQLRLNWKLLAVDQRQFGHLQS
jgi:hypothetical protein